jgi:hypothetical protein
MFYNSHNLTFG